MEHDVLMAIDRFKEEVKGLREYSEMLSKANSVELKDIFSRILEHEKNHISELLKFINSHSQHILK